MSNRLEVLPRAVKYLKKLSKQDKKLQQRYQDALHLLLENPYAGSLKAGDLSGIYSLDIYHSGTNYEIAYCIESDSEGNIIIILLAGTRENFYEELKRYMKNNPIKKRTRNT